MILYIWGTGRLVGHVLESRINIQDVAGFIDNNEDKIEYMGKPIYRPSDFSRGGVLENDFSAILVTTVYSAQIRKQCIELGIDLDKVIFLYNNIQMLDFNKDYKFISNIVGKEYAEIIRNRYHLVRSMENSICALSNMQDVEQKLEIDYVRIKTFELAVYEIKRRNVTGAVAELGVYQGDFAQYINAVFPERTCYLFDTFEGFNANEASKEKNEGNCTEAFVQAYLSTNVELVMNKMHSPQNVVIKAGYFPDSLEGLEERFAFVSLDVDFEKSIYNGLEYFYPRMNNGGYIFVHDFNGTLKGVRKAIDMYEKNTGSLLHAVPLCDNCGTLVIVK